LRTLLINPNETSQGGFSNAPLGLAYLAGMLEKNNLSVRIVDGYLVGLEGILKEVQNYKPDIIGITCYTPGRINALKIAKLIKEIRNEICVVMGGPHPTIMWKQILSNYPDVDICVIGEGEQTILEIVQKKPLIEINGIAWRDAGIIKKNPDRPYFKNLDMIPFPAWHLLQLSKYPSFGSEVFNGIDLSIEPRIPVIFSRGCTANCSFCSTWWIWKGHRCRSAKNMVDELEILYRNFGIRHFIFEDDAFSANMSSAKQFCQELIIRGLKIAWFATTRVDAVDEELLKLMSESGCYGISYGVETGSQKLLDIIGKKATIKQAKEAILATKKIGIKVTALLIVGSHGETKATINETVEFLNEVSPHYIGSVGGLWIFPGTALYQYAKKERLIDDEFWLSDQPIQVFLAEHSQKDLQRFNFAVTKRKRLDSLDFILNYAFEGLRLSMTKISIAKKIYRKINPKRFSLH
jgi:anaerobic magnesium-protoporphyrin IX monomethyl ester cyclase